MTNSPQTLARSSQGDPASDPRRASCWLGYRRVSLAPGESATVRFEVPTTRLAFSDRNYNRVVEPGDVDLWVGTSAKREVQACTTLVGEVHPVTNDSPRFTHSSVAAG